MSVKTFDSVAAFVPTENKGKIFAQFAGIFATMGHGMRCAAIYQDLIARGCAPETAARKVLEGFDRR